MMPAPLGEPVRKVLVRLFEADAVAMQSRYGRGWSGKLRELLRQHVRELRQGMSRQPGGRDRV
jgi:hypothetical protein